MLSPSRASSCVNAPRHCSSFRAPGSGCDGNGCDGDRGDAPGEMAGGRLGIPIVRDRGGDSDGAGRGRLLFLLFELELELELENEREPGTCSFRAGAGARIGRMGSDRSMKGSVHVER